MQLIKFLGANGNNLVGWLHVPTIKPRGALVLAHCFTCSKDLILYREVAQGLAEDGFFFLRFDFTGIGQSEGDFADTTLHTNISDLSLAVHELRKRAEDVPVGAIGHSLGGTATLLAMTQLDEVSAVAVIATPADPDTLRHLLATQPKGPIPDSGVMKVRIGGRSFVITPAFLDSLRETHLLQRVSELQRPMLVIHGTADPIVSIENGERLFTAAKQPKGFEPIWGGDHLLSPPQHIEAVRKILSAWFGRNLTSIA